MFNNYNQKFSKLKEYLLENFLLGKLSMHGPSHWDRVLENGLLIAKEDSNIDKLIIILFSYIHDSKRIDEYTDAEHGERAASSIEELEKLKLININASLGAPIVRFYKAFQKQCSKQFTIMISEPTTRRSRGPLEAQHNANNRFRSALAKGIRS